VCVYIYIYIYTHTHIYIYIYIYIIHMYEHITCPRIPANSVPTVFILFINLLIFY